MWREGVETALQGDAGLGASLWPVIASRTSQIVAYMKFSSDNMYIYTRDDIWPRSLELQAFLIEWCKNLMPGS